MDPSFGTAGTPPPRLFSRPLRRILVSTYHDQVAMPIPLPTNSNALHPTRRENRLRVEINIDSIRALDEEIRKQEEIIIKLKRTRNSLLNVSMLPPEVLGGIFHWNVMREGDFDGLKARSHNFLLVCHHWFEVASCTPELWSFWGKSLKDWVRWYSRSKTIPLDLVLDADAFYDERLSKTLIDALQGHVNRDTIRRVHLRSRRSVILTSVLSSLTSRGGEVRSNSMESLVLWNRDVHPPVDLSNFFAGYHFPKLQRLELKHCTISTWDHLMSRTGALTNLSLCLARPPCNVTTSQLLSIFASNPLLQRIALVCGMVPNDYDDDLSSCVPLRHLKYLELAGNLQDIFRLLHRLDHPEILDELVITPNRYMITEISQIIGPYFRDHLERCGRNQSGLGLDLRYKGDCLVLRVGVVVGGDPRLLRMGKVVTLNAGGQNTGRAVLDLIAQGPREEFVHFQVLNKTRTMGDIHTSLPNLRTLHLTGLHLPTAFPERNSGGDEGILPCLRHLILECSTTDDGDWSPLLTFLAGRASTGNRLCLLRIVGVDRMSSEMEERIRELFEGLRDRETKSCPTGAHLELVR